MTQSRHAFRPFSVIVAATMLVALLAGIQPPAAKAGDGTGIRFLGKLPVPKEVDEVGRDSQFEVFLVLPRARRMYLKFTRGSEVWIREYDLNTKIPTPIKEAAIANSTEIGVYYPFSRNKVAYDSRRDQLLLLAVAAGEPANCEQDPLCSSGTGAPAFVKILRFDRKTLKRTGVANLTVSLPEFVPQGMTYAPEDDLVYLVGDVNPLGYVNPNEVFQGRNPRLVPVAVTAVEPDTGRLRWIKIVPECPVLMTTQFLGAGIYRSSRSPSLYFACVQTGDAPTPPSPEPSGVVRITIDPKATTTQAREFPTEYFPISGAYATGGGISGVANFDPLSERFFMQSQSSTLPGVWVFDGRLSGWVGFIVAPDSSIEYAGTNRLTGRYYIGGATYIIPLEGRHTPVPQGRVVPIASVQSQMYVDDLTGRIFLREQEKSGKLRWVVYQDDIPLSLPDPATDYDELTTDLPEGPSTISTFAGSLNGFGVQVVLAGGTGAIVDPYCQDFGVTGCSTFRQALRDVFNLSPTSGPRALFASHVPSIDVRNVGAAAEARALAPDPVTEGEYVTVVQAVAAQARDASGEEPGDGGSGDEIEKGLAWPHLGTFCLDAGDEPKTDETSAQGGQATVSCDLGKEKAAATTSHKTLEIEGLSIAASSFEAESHRDPKLGIVTTATAIAQGVKLDIPGAAVVDIHRVTTKATTKAHGADGSASATWERILEGVVVRNGAGDVVFECSTGKDCDPVVAVAAINEVLKSRVQVKLPKVELIKSPGGAFAAVQETEGDFYNGLVANDEGSRAVPGMEIVLYNDTQLKSRIVVQLAAIQASSIYGVTPLSEAGPDDFIGPPPILPPVGPIAPPVDIVGPGYTPPSSSGPVVSLVNRAVFSIRSPKDALLFGLMLLLFGGALAAGWRRRVLLRQLAGE